MRISRMAERARLGDSRKRLSEVGCGAPGGVGLSSGVEGRRVGEGKALDQSFDEVLCLGSMRGTRHVRLLLLRKRARYIERSHQGQVTDWLVGCRCLGQ